MDVVVVDPWLPGSAAARRRTAWTRAARYARAGVFLAVLLWSAWTASVVQAVDPQRIVQAARKQHPAALALATALQQTMNAIAGKDEATQLRVVNDFYNQHIAYKEDIDNWGQLDYWASPLEMMDKGAGDCEDYVIGKYFTLVALGVPQSKLRLVYVRASMPSAPNGYIPHMVLAYYPQADAQPQVLDILVPDIRSADARPDLTPVFSFNAEGLWQGVGSIRANGDPLTRLSRWREVLQKARQEGFQ